jgi:hypothetical protein
MPRDYGRIIIHSKEETVLVLLCIAVEEFQIVYVGAYAD